VVSGNADGGVALKTGRSDKALLGDRVRAFRQTAIGRMAQIDVDRTTSALEPLFSFPELKLRWSHVSE